MLIFRCECVPDVSRLPLWRGQGGRRAWQGRLWVGEPWLFFGVAAQGRPLRVVIFVVDKGRVLGRRLVVAVHHYCYVYLQRQPCTNWNGSTAFSASFWKHTEARTFSVETEGQKKALKNYYRLIEAAAGWKANKKASSETCSFLPCACLWISILLLLETSECVRKCKRLFHHKWGQNNFYTESSINCLLHGIPLLPFKIQCKLKK